MAADQGSGSSMGQSTAAMRVRGKHIQALAPLVWTTTARSGQLAGHRGDGIVAHGDQLP